MRDVIGKKDHVSIASVGREIRYWFPTEGVYKKILLLLYKHLQKLVDVFSARGPQPVAFLRAGKLLTHRQIVCSSQPARTTQVDKKRALHLV